MNLADRFIITDLAASLPPFGLLVIAAVLVVSAIGVAWLAMTAADDPNEV